MGALSGEDLADSAVVPWCKQYPDKPMLLRVSACQTETIASQVIPLLLPVSGSHCGCDRS
ncbi:hypothetical protein NG791_20205 [Laspinema sp. D1]|uniref:hypothetical protein n=1 Tax=Laspinema palackyanum TaxID=3231601 RepID=UPI003498D943|nr:hypothetical protein [Laspinema sp. D2b]